MSFEHDFGAPAKRRSPQVKTGVTFSAVLESQRSLKDGGMNITLGLDETEVLAVMKLLTMRNCILEVTVVPKIPETYGGAHEKNEA